ncbi:MobP3 family relaxase [Moorella sp. ACPs]|uniref:MobP3 family relaxase n=1 Tax=Neomoorella carbonis TaxID=3062783 RepID=UPI0032542FC9
MSKSVVIVNVAYYQPGTKKMACNYNHIRYIATKPEADRGDPEAYRVGDEDFPVELGTAAGHVKYAAERPGSSGLFGPEGEPVPNWKEIGSKLARHNLPVWRVIVSLRQDDAERLGLVEREKWQASIENGVNNAFKAMHLDPDHARWVAAFHRKEGHPHCHVVIWEEEHGAARRQGYLEPGERKGVFRSFAREVFREERDRLTAEKTAIRDAIRELAGNDISKVTEFMREVQMARLEARALTGANPKMLPVLTPGREDELGGRLLDLARVMPGKGRIALAYMPEEVKEKARETADWLLKQPSFRQSTERYRELARQLASHYTMQPGALDEAARKAYEDIRDRLAQEVLKGAAAIQKHLERLEPTISPVVEEAAAEEKALILVTGQASERHLIPRHIVYVTPEESAQRLWRSVCRGVNRAYRGEKPEAPVIKPELKDELQKEIIERLKELAGAMPDQQGKPGLAYLPEDLQEKARDLAMLLLNREELQGRFGELNNSNPDKTTRLLEYIADQAVARAYDLLPREVPDIEMVLHPRRQMEAAAKLLAARADLIKGDYAEIYWTVGTIYRAMTRLEAPPEIVREAAVRFGRQAGLNEDKIAEVIANEISRMEELARKYEEQGLSAPRHISRDAWQRLTENLGLEEHDLLYPWFGIKRPGPEDKQKQELREQLNVRLVEERITSALIAIREARDRPEDPGELRWTLVTMTSTLKALGVDEADREEMVRGWCRRAGVKITEARLLDVLDRVTIGQDDLWLGKRSWDRLMANLGIDEAPPSPWDVNIPRQMVRNTGITHDVWKAAWRALERERTRAEAQAQLLAERDLERRRRRAREEGREMGML